MQLDHSGNKKVFRARGTRGGKNRKGSSHKRNNNNYEVDHDHSPKYMYSNNGHIGSQQILRYNQNQGHHVNGFDHHGQYYSHQNYYFDQYTHHYNQFDNNYVMPPPPPLAMLQSSSFSSHSSSSVQQQRDQYYPEQNINMCGYSMPPQHQHVIIPINNGVFLNQSKASTTTDTSTLNYQVQTKGSFESDNQTESCRSYKQTENSVKTDELTSNVQMRDSCTDIQNSPIQTKESFESDHDSIGIDTSYNMCYAWSSLFATSPRSYLMGKKSEQLNK